MKELIKKCKCGVYIEVNNHKNNYQSVEEYFKELSEIREDLFKEISEDIYKEMIERDSVIEIQYYPNTPVGFHRVYHYDLNEAIKLTK